MVLSSNSHPTWPSEIWNHNSNYGSVKLFTVVPLQNVTPEHSVQSPSQTTHTNLSLCFPIFSLCSSDTELFDVLTECCFFSMYLYKGYFVFLQCSSHLKHLLCEAFSVYFFMQSELGSPLCHHS